MSTKHTPGPWKAFNCIGPRSLKNWHIQADELKGRPVATIADIGDGDAANAQLIAAAPELLEALEFMLEADTNICENIGRKSDQAMTRIAAIDQARVAIAKAKGQS